MAESFIRYFVHDGDTFFCPAHYASASWIKESISQLREQAQEDLKRSDFTHAVYAVKHMNEDGALEEIDLYAPPILMYDAEYQERTEFEDGLILAVHKK